MPIITVKLLRGAFSHEQKQELARDITDAVVRMGGAGIRPATSVLIEEVDDAMWSIGGAPLSLAEIKARRRAR